MAGECDREAVGMGSRGHGGPAGAGDKGSHGGAVLEAGAVARIMGTGGAVGMGSRGQGAGKGKAWGAGSMGSGEPGDRGVHGPAC